MTAAVSSAPETRTEAWGRYALPLMLGFAVAGGAIGFSVESVLGGADPAFASTLGGALGGVFGRAVWRRRRDAIAYPTEARFGLSMLMLIARVAACAAVGVALVGSMGGDNARAVSLGGTARGVLAFVGAIVLVGTSAAEAQRIARLRALSSTPRPGTTHDA